MFCCKFQWEVSSPWAPRLSKLNRSPNRDHSTPIMHQKRKRIRFPSQKGTKFCNLPNIQELPLNSSFFCKFHTFLPLSRIYSSNSPYSKHRGFYLYWIKSFEGFSMHSPKSSRRLLASCRENTGLWRSIGCPI